MSEHSAANQPGPGFGSSLRHIHARYPALIVRSARHEPAGQRSKVLVINDSLVFRFPRTSAEVGMLATEASILRAIRGRLPLPTPDRGYENLDTRTEGAAFIGYGRLPGEPLWRDTTVLSRGRVPYYSTGVSNLRSTRLALGLGYKPAWVELYARSLEP